MLQGVTEPGAPASISVQRHPPERGLTHALYGGSCCTTCCCCCCCCAHTVGGLVGAAAGSWVAPALAGEAEASERARKTYWSTLRVVVLTTGALSLVAGPLGPLALLFILPALQIVASLVELSRIRKAPPEERLALRRQLFWITGGSLAGTLVGAAALWSRWR